MAIAKANLFGLYNVYGNVWRGLGIVRKLLCTSSDGLQGQRKIAIYTTTKGRSHRDRVTSGFQVSTTVSG
jgi:hypothetical protein